MSVLKGLIPLITRKLFFKAALFLLLAASACLNAAIPSLDFITGKALFEKLWVFAPSSTGASDGLGPYFNARSCHTCHADGGRGSLQHRTVQLNDSVYGQQLQAFTRPGVTAEAEFALVAESVAPNLSRPRVDVSTWHAGVPDSMAMSVRLPPTLAGLGLLAAIPDAAVLALADPDDADGDGISGRVNRLADNRVGRFGWKASQPDLRTQTGRALSLDLGLGNPVFPSAAGDCRPAQTDCANAAMAGDSLEVDDTGMSLILSYVSAVPVRDPVKSPAMAHGKTLFNQVGCQACHGGLSVAGGPEPYTDLLLHDMGPGLADSLSEGSANGSEWRTAPLWGLGRRPADSGYLHDGRAATLAEAIAWHDGEAAPARAAYRQLNEADKRDVITFLNGL